MCVVLTFFDRHVAEVLTVVALFGIHKCLVRLIAGVLTAINNSTEQAPEGSAGVARYHFFGAILDAGMSAY